MKPKSLKCQQLYACNNQKDEGLDKFEGESKEKDIEYILFTFITPPQKESNSLTDMGKGIKSLNHFIYIPKIG